MAFAGDCNFIAVFFCDFVDKHLCKRYICFVNKTEKIRTMAYIKAMMLRNTLYLCVLKHLFFRPIYGAWL